LLYYLQKLSRSPADLIQRQTPKKFEE
jgi:hypothetical protein